MNAYNLSLPRLTCISQHGFAALFENNDTGEKSLHSTTAYNAGDVLATFAALEIFSVPNKYTVQTGDNTHIIMTPEVFKFINHSCNPNIFLDTSLFQIKALKYIAEGDELQFFYPSTEWMMQVSFYLLLRIARLSPPNKRRIFFIAADYC